MSYIHKTIFIIFILLVPLSYSELDCVIDNDKYCDSPKIPLFYIDSNSNSHIYTEISSAPDSAQAICCEATDYIYPSCLNPFTELFGRISNLNNAHFQQIAKDTYPYDLCLSSAIESKIECRYGDGSSIETEEDCIFAMENKESNSMVGSCANGNYPIKIICKVVFEEDITCDEGNGGSYYIDEDGDGFGSDILETFVCDDNHHASNNDDCNDNPSTGGVFINPNATEKCNGIDDDCDSSTKYDQEVIGDLSVNYEESDETLCDGKDNDCDGDIDEGLKVTVYLDNDFDGFGNDDISKEKEVCPNTLVGGKVNILGKQYVDNTEFDCNDNNAAINPDADETCNGVDDNCKDGTDEDLTPIGAGVGVCQGIPYICDGVNGWVNDTATYLNLSDYRSTETLCDNKDNDCNGIVDIDGFPTLNQACSKTYLSCTNEGIKVCNLTSKTSTYCDAENIIFSSVEYCDGIDNDCDTQVDELEDLVDHGAELQGGICGGAQAVCEDGEWREELTELEYLEYNSYYETVEISCDGKDNDCDGTPDETENMTIPEVDDRWRIIKHFLEFLIGENVGRLKDKGVCAEPTYTCLNSDWSVIIPDYVVDEVNFCDGKDNDCDGTIDEGCDEICDYDQDNYIDGWNNYGGCFAYALYKGIPTGDCDDLNNYTYPGAEEICDGEDNDCDSSTPIDENIINIPLSPNQKGVCEETLAECIDGSWQLPNFNDGEMLAKGMYESFEVTCDGLNNDCDDKTDEFSEYVSGFCLGEIGECAFNTSGGFYWEKIGGNIIELDETCNGLDDDCDTIVDNGFDIGDYCEEGIGVCLDSGTKVCTLNGLTTKCSVSAKIPLYINEAINTTTLADNILSGCNGLDDDCDGTPDEECDCDNDLDNDGIINEEDESINGILNTLSNDWDNDTIINSIDEDDDGDCIRDPYDIDEDNNFDDDNDDNEHDLDDDGDGIPDILDDDDDNDGLPDNIDDDDDNDGILDEDETDYDINDCMECDACGDGGGNICDLNECTACGLNSNGCIFEDRLLLPNLCEPSEDISCSDYTTNESCYEDLALLGDCEWNYNYESCCELYYYDEISINLTLTSCGGTIPEPCKTGIYFLSIDNEYVCVDGLMKSCEVDVNLCDEEVIDGITYVCEYYEGDYAWVDKSLLYQNDKYSYLCENEIKEICGESNTCQSLFINDERFFCAKTLTGSDPVFVWYNYEDCKESAGDDCTDEGIYGSEANGNKCNLERGKTCVFGDGCEEACEDDLDCLLDEEFIVYGELSEKDFNMILNELRIKTGINSVILTNRLNNEINYQLEVINNTDKAENNRVSCENINGASIQENCVDQGDKDCWIELGPANNKCCHSLSISWADPITGIACAGGEFSKDADQNALHCVLLSGSDSITGNHECDEDGETNCYSPDILIDVLEDKSNLCCGDDPDEDWNVFTDSDFDRLLVNAICVEGAWKNATMNKFSYDIITAEK